MGEALEKAKQNLRLTNKPASENIVKKDDITLEDAISQVDSLEAREVLRAKARELRATMELRAREAEARLRDQGGNKVEKDEEEKAKKETRLREQITASAMMMLEKGIDPAIVGQYIMGSTPVTPITVSGSGPAHQGLTISDVRAIFELVSANKGTSELTTILTSLKDEIKNIGKGGNGGHEYASPLEQAKMQAQMIKATIDAFRDAGLIKEGTTVTTGESIEVVRERNRHEEELEKIRADKDFKDKLADTAESIPEMIGMGGAAHIMSKKTSPKPPASNQAKSSLSFKICDDCGTKIYYGPETGNEIVCPNPKCNAVYGYDIPEEKAAE